MPTPILCSLPSIPSPDTSATRTIRSGSGARARRRCRVRSAIPVRTSWCSARRSISSFGNGMPAIATAADAGPGLGPGEYLDKVVLQNCLGGRFSPGIDLTFIVRDPTSNLYIEDWQTSAGPFRIKPAAARLQRRAKRQAASSPKAMSPCTAAIPASSRGISANSWRSPGTPTTIPAQRIRPNNNPVSGQTVLFLVVAGAAPGRGLSCGTQSGRVGANRSALVGARNRDRVAASVELGTLSGTHQYD